MKIYAIWDNKQKEFVTNGAKGIWLKKGSAKNALMLRLYALDKDDYTKKLSRSEVTKDWLDNNDKFERRYLSFADQTRYECWEYDLKNNVDYKKV